MKIFEEIVADMTIICNIQNMCEAAGLTAPTYDSLSNLPTSLLRELQDELIPIYNLAVKEEKL